MIVSLKKATLDDIDRLTIAIMALGDLPYSITTSEMADIIDYTYYMENDDGLIMALVSAVRLNLTDGTTKYQIKYALYDKTLISYSIDRSVESIMELLIRELCASLSEWSVWIDIDYQASIGLDDTDGAREVLQKAVLRNGFKNAENRFSYIRVMPIDFDSLH